MSRKEGDDKEQLFGSQVIVWRCRLQKVKLCPFWVTFKSCKWDLILCFSLSSDTEVHYMAMSDRIIPKISVTWVSVELEINKTIIKKNKTRSFCILKVAKESKGGSQAVTIKCFTFYPPVSCSAGNHVFQFNARHIIIATYACFLITSHNWLLLHSFIMRHPWSCSKFYQVWLLSPPFPFGLSNGHCLAYDMELSGSIHSQLQFWKQSSEVPFICVLSIVHMHYKFLSLMHFWKFTLGFFY